MAKTIIQFDDKTGPTWSPNRTIEKYLISVINLKNKKEEYIIEVEDKIFNSTVVNNMIYLGSRDNHVYAINILTGKKLWKFKTGDSVESPPVVNNNVVYLGSNDQHFYALNATTGEEIWKFKVSEPIFRSAIIFEKLIIFSGGKDKCIYGLNATTGEKIWKFETEGWVMSTPVLFNNVVYFGSNDKHLYALDAYTGKEMWKFKSGDSIKTSPVLTEESVYTGSNDAHIYAIDISTGEEKWKYKTDDMWVDKDKGLALNNKMLFSGGSYLYALDSITGKEKWKSKWGYGVGHPITILDGLIYSHSTDKKIHVTDSKTGKEKGVFEVGYPTYNIPSLFGDLICLSVKKDFTNENANKEFDNRVKFLNNFLNKYNNVHKKFSLTKDISTYFDVDSKNGQIEMLIDKSEILIPEDNDHFMAKFFSSDVGNNRGAGMGQEPFENEFYKNLFDIFKDDNDEVYSDLNITVSGNFDEVYSGTVTLKEDGLHWEMDEDWSDEDEDW